MFSEKVVIRNKTGLHARPASELTNFCKKYSEEIKIIGNGKTINPKSIITILSAGLTKGTEIEIQVSGENEDSVGKELIQFIKGLTD